MGCQGYHVHLMRLLIAYTLALASAATCFSACGGSAPTAERELVAVAHPAGSWEGTGNTTIGFVSDTGRFRIRWQTRHEGMARSGTFRLTVHSAVSGRPIQVVVDHQGEGSGQTDFADDPRPYNLMVEATNLEWSFSVDAISVIDAKAPAAPR